MQRTRGHTGFEGNGLTWTIGPPVAEAPLVDTGHSIPALGKASGALVRLAEGRFRVASIHAERDAVLTEGVEGRAHLARRTEELGDGAGCRGEGVGGRHARRDRRHVG